MNREQKLNHLISILEQDMPGFAMETWFSRINLKERGVNPDCGFAACALGHAAMDPVFMHMGLELIVRSDVYSEITYGGRTAFGAAENFFEITDKEAYFLFNPEEYYTDQCFAEIFETVEDTAKDESTSLYFYDIDEDDIAAFYDRHDGDKDYPYPKVTPAMVIKHIEFVRDNPGVINF